MIAVIRGALVVVMLMLAVGDAHAQRSPNVSADVAAHAVAADAALSEGRRFYDVREWDKAIAKFKEAYTLRPDAASLFNLAQSYRLKGDCINASGFYKTFRRNYPKEKNIDKVDKFIVEMDACAKTQPPPKVETPVTPAITQKPIDTSLEPVSSEPSTTPAPAVTAEPSSPPMPPPSQDRSGMKWAGVGMIGVGLIGIGVGTKFALDGGARADDLKSKCAVSCTSAEALAIEDKGKSANKKAYIFTPVGGALVIGGAVLFFLSRGGDESTPQVSLAPTVGGATAAYSFSF